MGTMELLRRGRDEFADVDGSDCRARMDTELGVEAGVNVCGRR